MNYYEEAARVSNYHININCFLLKIISRTKLFLTLFLLITGLSLNGQYFLGLSKTELIKDLNYGF